MRIFIFTLLLSLCLVNVSKAKDVVTTVATDAMSIFDPATVDTTTLPAGMTIVEIDGKKFAQVVLNGWNSTIKIPEFTLQTGMSAYCNIKYSLGENSIAKPLTLANINGVVQLMDTINRVTNPWGAGTIPSSAGLSQSPITGKWGKISANLAAEMKIIHQIQFFGQETIGWGPTTGDTIWVGKIRAQVNEDGVVFNPVNLEPNDAMSIVEIGGEKFAQIILNDWNSIINVPEFPVQQGMVASCNFKFAIGANSIAKPLTLSKINGVVQLMDTVNRVPNQWGAGTVPSSVGLSQSPVTGALSKISATINADMKIIHQIQFFGQETVSWGPTTGDTVWVGKVSVITVTPPDPNIIIDPATFTGTLGTGWEIVTVDGTKYFKVAIDGWNSSMKIPEFTFPAGTTGFKASVKYEKGTAEYTIEEINVFLKLSTSGWAEIAAGASAASATFKDYVINIADPSMKAGVFQVAAQESVSGNGTALSGDFLYISKIVAIQAAPVTFIVDDSKYKTNTGFKLKGSWNAIGEYDSKWNGGAEHTSFYDDGTNGDATAGDFIWSVTLNLVPDAGKNTWEWGFNDLNGTWVPTGNTQFKVSNTSAVSTTYVISTKVGVEDLSTNFSIYPNPATNLINIAGTNVKSVEIFNLSGAKAMATTALNTIDISSLKKGAYLVKVIGEDGKMAVRKLNKN